MKLPILWCQHEDLYLLYYLTVTDFLLKRAVKSGWDEMSDRYQRDAVISTDDVHYGTADPRGKRIPAAGRRSGEAPPRARVWRRAELQSLSPSGEPASPPSTCRRNSFRTRCRLVEERRRADVALDTG